VILTTLFWLFVLLGLLRVFSHFIVTANIFIVNYIDREFEFYEFFSFSKFNEFYEFFSLEKKFAKKS